MKSVLSESKEKKKRKKDGEDLFNDLEHQHVVQQDQHQA